MRLKQLEIKGFKSFADKTVVNFDEGITGIIGPNGCGKSNIIDAVRWVIGEQKISALRSENLDALVFNGSKTRSASGLAEVSLTFDNTRNLLPTEFSTVTVTRRFFKNGESEYRLNDVTCRLKDIHNLFLDTGVSTDSYAIIELGMVDDIIKDKENSRRRMLEQAAGITIYKTRKKEAKLKLDATETDLNRIEDLLFEINNQLKSLESQARKAERYYEIKKDYREVSIELAKASLEGFNTVYKDLTEKQQEESDKKVQIEAEIATAEAEIEKDKLNFIEQEKALQTMQHAFNDLVQNLRSKENEKNLANQRLQFLTEKESGLKDFLAKAKEQLKSIEESVQFTRTSIDEEEKELINIQHKVSGEKQSADDKRREFEEKRAAVEKLRQQHQQLQRSFFDAEKKVAVADSSIQNLLRAQQQLATEKANREFEAEQLNSKLKEQENTLQLKQRDLTTLQEHQAKTRELILHTQKDLEALRNKLAEENRKLDAKRNEHALLKNLIDSMEGYPASVKFLHKNPNWNYKAPILSDIIYVKEEYRAAVENVLEPYLNYYVVENLEQGLQAIQLLDSNKKGKANFFLLDKLNESENDTGGFAAHKPDGTIDALSVIEVDEQFRHLANFLLRNVFIAESDDALQNSNGSIVLEKSGKYVKGKYSITGGSVGLFEGKKIGRVKNLEKLLDDIKKQEEVVNNLKQEIKLKQDDVLEYNQQMEENATDQVQREINTLSNGIFGLKNKLENLHASEHNATIRNQEIATRIQTEQEATGQTRNLLQDFTAQLQQIVEQMQAAEELHRSSEKEYTLASQQYNESNILFTRQQSKIVALKKEFEFKENQLHQLHSQIEQNTKQLSESSTNIQNSETSLTEVKTLLEELIKNREAEEIILNRADQAYYNHRSQLQEKENHLKQKVKNKEIIEHLVADIKDKLNELKLQLASMKERLNVEFRIELDEIIDEPRKTETALEDLQASSDKMKKRLENIGEINPTAIEAFQEMKNRYDFITEQKNDLTDAKDSLMQTIKEVEATANQQFLDTFNKVRENFQKVFKALFSEEDTADLVLENPENLAETGLDIVAKPKGKRPSSITQLSGGEKTLTATALLFAIYLIKPAPFCILDEVDAPLDDANVTKFTQMIHQFSENSQFIIVTHNKMTMSAVDVIYGVTMQEAGVSKLVPVDFRSLAAN